MRRLINHLEKALKKKKNHLYILLKKKKSLILENTEIHKIKETELIRIEAGNFP